VEVNPWEVDFYGKQRKIFTDRGGELINLPADEQSQMMQSLEAVGAAVAKRKPRLQQAYDVFAEVAKRTKQ